MDSEFVPWRSISGRPSQNLHTNVLVTDPVPNVLVTARPAVDLSCLRRSRIQDSARNFLTPL